MYYHLSLGTNLEPQKNAAAILHALCAHFGEVVICPFIETTPHSIKTDKMFLNAVAIVRSDKTPEQIKAITNQIEVSLGRDRSDPNSSKKDRAADIDIEHVASDLNFNYFKACPEPYIHEVLKCDPKKRTDLQEYGVPYQTGMQVLSFDPVLQRLKSQPYAPKPPQTHVRLFKP